MSIKYVKLFHYSTAQSVAQNPILYNEKIPLSAVNHFNNLFHYTRSAQGGRE